jgi:peptide/nickel transport system substrate-binding protein
MAWFRTGFVAALLGAALVLSSCGRGDSGEGESRGLTRVEAGRFISVLRSDKSDNLDPHSTSSGGDVRVLVQIYEGLVKASVGTEQVEWLPHLATGWEINDDHTVYTFTIRQGVKFHDGTALNAPVVKQSLDRLVLEEPPAKPLERPYRDSYFKDVQSIETPDDWTLVVTHKSPNPRFLGTLGLHSAMIVSSRALDHLATVEPNARKAWLTSNPAGTGPFSIRVPGDYADGTSITLTRFDGYWDGKPELERIVFETQQETRVRTQRVRAGSVHFVDSLDPSDWGSLERDPAVHLHTWLGQNLCYLALNCSPEHGHVTADVRVRRAIALAIDREPMVAKYSGRAVPQHVLIPPTMLGHPRGYRPPSDLVPRSDALAQARTLIEEAGATGARLLMYYPDTARGYLLYPDEIANFVQEQLSRIGLEVVLDKRPLAELTTRVHQGVYPLVLIGWMGDTGEPHNFWHPLLSGADGRPAGNNNTRFYHPEVAAKVDKAGVETDPTRRAELYYELEKWVHEEFRPMVPLLSAEQSYAWVSKLKGVIVDSTGDFHFHRARFED